MKHYKGNQKGLIEFANGVTAPNGKVYNYLCQCANPDRYILVNTGDPGNHIFNNSVWGYDGKGSWLEIQEYDQ